MYPVRIRLQDADGIRLRTLMTSLIRLPEAGRPRHADRCHAAGGRPPATARKRCRRSTTDAADRSLLDDLEPVLDTLAERPALPATFSITPDTLARIAGDDDADGADACGRNSPPRDAPCSNAPYVDVDAASLVRANLADSTALRRRTSAARRSPTCWSAAPRGDLAAAQPSGQATVTQLRARGVTRTLLPGDALNGGTGVLAPVDLQAGGGTTRAVSVSSTYTLGVDPLDDPVLAAHRLLARLSATGAGPTGTPAVVVWVDPALVSEKTLAIVADALSFGSPFFAATDLPTLLDAPPAAAGASLATPVQPGLGAYP